MEIYSEISNNENLILFYNGCGMDENQIKHYKHLGYDLIVFYDYSSLKLKNCSDEKCISGQCRTQCPMFKIFSNYQNIYIIAWGAGVWAANASFYKYLDKLKKSNSMFNLLKIRAKIKSCIAINGTILPISNFWGIPQESYESVVEKLPYTNKKILEDICSDSIALQDYNSHISKRSFENIAREIISLRDNYFFCNTLDWDTILISNNDAIIPSNNLKMFWHDYSNGTEINNFLKKRGKKIRITEIKAGHYPLHLWNSWDEILSYAK